MKRALERAKNKGKIILEGNSKKKGKAQAEKKEFLDGSDNISNSKPRAPKKAKH